MTPQENMHGQLQWYLDCYVESDLEKELDLLASGTAGDITGEVTEVALKALAVGLLFAVEEDAAELSVTPEGLVARLPGGDRTIALPPEAVVGRAVEIIRQIGDLGEDAQERVLSLGLRNDEVAVTARLTDAGVTLSLPKS